MATSPFERAFGQQQGRIAPAGWGAPDGDHVFVLGHDTPGRFESLAVGDFVEVQQNTFVAPATKFIRVRAFLRGPAVVVPGAAWDFSLRLDGVERVVRRMREGASRDLRDLAINVSNLDGSRLLAARLTLVSA